MRFTNDNNDDQPEINVISLIDVILVLLIFFMATATFEQQARLKLNLPQASAAQTESDRQAGLAVQVSEDGRYFVSAREVTNTGIEALKEALSAAANGNFEQRVILRAAARTRISIAAYPLIDEIVKAALPQWRARHPEVDIQVVSRQYADHHTAMTTALSTSVYLPDVMPLEASYLGRFSSGDGLERLGGPPYGAETLRDGFVGYALEL